MPAEIQLLNELRRLQIIEQENKRIQEATYKILAALKALLRQAEKDLPEIAMLDVQCIEVQLKDRLGYIRQKVADIVAIMVKDKKKYTSEQIRLMLGFNEILWLKRRNVIIKMLRNAGIKSEQVISQGMHGKHNLWYV